MEVNTEDASRLNIKNGDQVVVETRRDALTLPAHVNDTCKPGLIAVPFFDKKKLVNKLFLDATDPRPASGVQDLRRTDQEGVTCAFGEALCRARQAITDLAYGPPPVEGRGGWPRVPTLFSIPSATKPFPLRPLKGKRCPHHSGNGPLIRLIGT
ncbi:MAG: molybdopterin dinucleotide binding domain-containing protein [Bilophila wadsworthia]